MLSKKTMLINITLFTAGLLFAALQATTPKPSAATQEHTKPKHHEIPEELDDYSDVIPHLPGDDTVDEILEEIEGDSATPPPSQLNVNKPEDSYDDDIDEEVVAATREFEGNAARASGSSAQQRNASTSPSVASSNSPQSTSPSFIRQNQEASDYEDDEEDDLIDQDDDLIMAGMDYAEKARTDQSALKQQPQENRPKTSWQAPAKKDIRRYKSAPTPYQATPPSTPYKRVSTPASKAPEPLKMLRQKHPELQRRNRGSALQ